MRKSHASGFTLVEALVAGIISLVLATVVFTVYSLHDRQLRESVLLNKLQRQYDNIIDQMAHDIRMATRAYNSTESFTKPQVTMPVDSSAKSIKLCDSVGAQMVSYSVSGDTLLRNGQPFQAGGGPALLNSAGSRFVLPPFRDAMAVRLTLKTAGRDTTYYLGPREDEFRCRN